MEENLEDNIDITRHLLEVENEAGQMVAEAEKEADSIIATARAEAEATRASGRRIRLDER